MVICQHALGQGGPPYYTNDTSTPGNRNWEINVGYMPFLYATQSTSHLPDLDINYGIGDRIQLTYENAWLRVGGGTRAAKYGLGQDQFGIKFRFFDNEKTGVAIATFPQLSVNNPNHSVQRGIVPRGASLIVPLEFTKQLRSINVNWEVGYNLVHLGPNGWIAGIVVGHDVSKRLQMDAELYRLGTFNLSNNQQTLGVGARYKLHPLCTLLLMAGRSVTVAHNGQPLLLAISAFSSCYRQNRFDLYRWRLWKVTGAAELTKLKLWRPAFRAGVYRCPRGCSGSSSFINNTAVVKSSSPLAA